jgi:hypothetical protein
MKNNLLLIAFVLIGSVCMGQSSFKEIYDYGQYKSNWAMVKSNEGLFGFIDKKGNVVVEPIYLEIFDFGDEHPNWARVKLANGNYAFIDKSGKEVSFKGQIVSL